MIFTFEHVNLNVADSKASVAFYEKALGLMEVRRIEATDGSYLLVFLSDASNIYRLELTWLRDKSGPYNLGDNESHLAFRVDDYPAAYAFHKEMGCICYENAAMGLYFISDPDGYWIEILPIRS